MPCKRVNYERHNLCLSENLCRKNYVFILFAQIKLLKLLRKCDYFQDKSLQFNFQRNLNYWQVLIPFRNYIGNRFCSHRQ